MQPRLPINVGIQRKLQLHVAAGGNLTLSLREDILLVPRQRFRSSSFQTVKQVHPNREVCPVGLGKIFQYVFSLLSSKFSCVLLPPFRFSCRCSSNLECVFLVVVVAYTTILFSFLPCSSTDAVPAPAADATPILACAHPRALHLAHRVGCRVGTRGPPPQPDLGAGVASKASASQSTRHRSPMTKLPSLSSSSNAWWSWWT
jgi:hypothetical protein